MFNIYHGHDVSVAKLKIFIQNFNLNQFFLKEYFDNVNKMSRIDYQPFTYDVIEDLGIDTITEIHDFREGLSFNIQAFIFYKS